MGGGADPIVAARLVSSPAGGRPSGRGVGVRLDGNRNARAISLPHRFPNVEDRSSLRSSSLDVGWYSGQVDRSRSTGS